MKEIPFCQPQLQDKSPQPQMKCLKAKFRAAQLLCMALTHSTEVSNIFQVFKHNG